MSIGLPRLLADLEAKRFDMVVIGGGITGASIARDAALRGLEVALVDKADFAHATSAASSKLIHGGLRYLETFDFGVVRESLRERRIWEATAPHMVNPLPFLLPTYGWTGRSGWYLGLGLTLYDLLSFDRNRLKDPDKWLPRHRSLSPPEAINSAPGLAQAGLTGAKLYYDCQMVVPERLALECVLSAAQAGACVVNHVEVTGFGREGGRIAGVTARDQLSGDDVHISGRLVVNAGGPWADKILSLAQGGPPSVRLVRSKGIHLVTRPLTVDHAVFVQPENGGHFFIMPWRGHSLIGTTDTPFGDEPDTVGVSEEEITVYLDRVNTAYPGAELTRADVLHAYAGLRPLVDFSSSDGSPADTYRLSRDAEIIDHEPRDGLAGLVSAMGGKWTTSRALAEDVVDLVVRKLDVDAKPCVTHCTATFGGGTGPIAAFRRDMHDRLAGLGPDTADHLVTFYGSQAPAVAGLAQGNLKERLSAERSDIGAQVVHAVRHEMAMTLEDVVMRRTGLGSLGHPGLACLEATAAIMAQELGWDAREIGHQIERTQSNFL